MRPQYRGCGSNLVYAITMYSYVTNMSLIHYLKVLPIINPTSLIQYRDDYFTVFNSLSGTLKAAKSSCGFN